MYNRKQELIDCCIGIIREADNITKDLEYSQDINIEIVMNVNEVPHIIIHKGFVPKNMIERLGSVHPVKPFSEEDAENLKNIITGKKAEVLHE